MGTFHCKRKNIHESLASDFQPVSVIALRTDLANDPKVPQAIRENYQAYGLCKDEFVE